MADLEEIVDYGFEAGRRGKPDEWDSQAAHLIGAYFLDQDINSRFNVRVNSTLIHATGRIRIGIDGEVSKSLLGNSSIYKDVERLVLDHYDLIHKGEDAGNIDVDINFKPQETALAINGHSGDIANPIAVAYRGTPNNLPWERYLSVEIRDLIDSIYNNDGKVPEYLVKESGIEKIEGLRSDGKILVNAQYKNSKLHRIDRILIAAGHEKALPVAELREKLSSIVNAYLKLKGAEYNANLSGPKIDINGLDDWFSLGCIDDSGSSDAKAYRDAFGPYGCVEDAFSGEDPSKPGATGTYLARYIANQVVNHGFADFARVDLKYNIGEGDISLNVTTNGTLRVPQEEIHAWVRENIPLTIGSAIQRFNLKDPALYRRIAQNSDFFHDPGYAWNKIDLN